jgi:hypothetical protein
MDNEVRESQITVGPATTLVASRTKGTRTVTRSITGVTVWMGRLMPLGNWDMANIALIKVEQCGENSCELSLLRIYSIVACNAVHYKRASAQVSPFPSEYSYSLIRGPKEEVILVAYAGSEYDEHYLIMQLRRPE